MSRYSEKKVLRKLGLKDWRGLTKDHYLKLVSMLPEMDVEVAKKCLEMVPELANVILNVTEALKEVGNNGLTSNEVNMQALRAGTEETRAIIKKQLEKSDITDDEKTYLYDKLLEILRMEYEKDTENKKFIKDVIKLIGAGLMFCASLVSAAIGVNAVTRKNQGLDNDINGIDDNEIAS